MYGQFVQIMHIRKSAQMCSEMRGPACKASSQLLSAVSLISANHHTAIQYMLCAPILRRHNSFSSVWTGIVPFAPLLFVGSSIYLNVLFKPSELKNVPSCCRPNICHVLLQRLASLIFQLVLCLRWLNKVDLHFWDNFQITDVGFSPDLLSNRVQTSEEAPFLALAFPQTVFVSGGYHEW